MNPYYGNNKDTATQFNGLGKVKKTPFSFPYFNTEAFITIIIRAGCKKCVIKRTFITQSLVHGFELIGDKDFPDDTKTSQRRRKNVLILVSKTS